MTTPAERLAALDAAALGPSREHAILLALEDEALPVRDRAIRLAARYVEPAVLGEMVADGENAVRRNAGLRCGRLGNLLRIAGVNLFRHEDPFLTRSRRCRRKPARRGPPYAPGAASCLPRTTRDAFR